MSISTEPVTPSETPEDRRTRLATELAMVLHQSAQSWARQHDGFPNGTTQDFFKNSQGWQDMLVFAARSALQTLHPTLSDYTLGLDRMVAFVDGLKKTGWVVMPNRGVGSTLLFKGYENLQMHMRILDTGSIKVEFQAVTAIPSLNLEANQSKTMEFPDLDHVLISLLSAVHGGFSVSAPREEPAKS